MIGIDAMPQDSRFPGARPAAASLFKMTKRTQFLLSFQHDTPNRAQFVLSLTPPPEAT